MSHGFRWWHFKMWLIRDVFQSKRTDVPKLPKLLFPSWLLFSVLLQSCCFFWFVFQYCLIKDVVSSLKKHRMHEEQFKYHPLLILNNFGQDGMHIKLMATMFQNMFPSINVHKVCFTTKATAIFFSLGDSRFTTSLIWWKYSLLSLCEDLSKVNAFWSLCWSIQLCERLNLTATEEKCFVLFLVF